MRGIRISLAIILSVLAIDAFAQSGLPTVKVQWTEVTTQTDGTVIPHADVAYTITDEFAVMRCTASNATTCSFDVGYDECVTLHATATQISTGLESENSNVVQVCGFPKPAFQLSPPVITVTISQG